jgi:anti-sigma factor RsiW
MSDEMACVELVELVTEYLEGELSDDERGAFRDHLRGCDGCTAYVEQFRALGRVAAASPPERLSRSAEEQVLAVFRRWVDHRPSP